MNFKPILFSTEMVKAILSGSKVQTRRVVKEEHAPVKISKDNQYLMPLDRLLSCPYGQVGDVLWVRETMVLNKNSQTYWPVADGYKRSISALTNKPFESEKVVPSIHMPKEACRLFLKIKSIRVERLQDISRGDAMAEGCPFPNIKNQTNPKQWFEDLWISINGKESWYLNPWVWVIEFERIEKPEGFI